MAEALSVLQTLLEILAAVWGHYKAILVAAFGGLILWKIGWRLWRWISRPPLVKLADGFPGGLDIIGQGEKDIVANRIHVYSQVDLCQQANQAVTAKLLVRKQTLRRIKQEAEDGSFDSDPRLQETHEAIICQALTEFMENLTHDGLSAKGEEVRTANRVDSKGER